MPRRPPLPPRPLPPPLLPFPPLDERGQHMTIAAGFVCSDGVVLGADTQVTGQTIKYSSDKVWVLSAPDASHCIAMAGAGDSVLIRALRDHLASHDQSGRPQLAEALSRLSAIAGPRQRPLDQLVEGLQRSLQKFYETHIYTYPTWETTHYRQLQFLLAIQIDGEAALFEHSAATLSWVDTCACIGSGSDIGHYIQATRFTADMDMRDGRRVAAHLLQQVKTYSPDCGGESTILLVPHQGETTFVEPRHIFEDEQGWDAAHPREP